MTSEEYLRARGWVHADAENTGAEQTWWHPYYSPLGCFGGRTTTVAVDIQVQRDLDCAAFVEEHREG